MSTAVVRTRGWWARRLIVVVLLAVLLFLAATLRLFVFPGTTAPARADAIVVLSGDYGDRMAEALRLIDRKVAPTLVHAGTPDSAFVVSLCAGRTRFKAVCLAPQPDRTQTEAGAIARLARDRRWNRLAVVTSTYHVTRAGLLLDRCYDGDLRMVASQPQLSHSFLATKIAHEWGGLIQALLLRRDC